MDTLSELDRRVVLVVQGLFLSGELPQGVRLEEALAAEHLRLHEVHFASLPGVNLPELTVRTAEVGAYGLGNHPRRHTGQAGTAPAPSPRPQDMDPADLQTTEYENIG